MLRCERRCLSQLSRNYADFWVTRRRWKDMKKWMNYHHKKLLKEIIFGAQWWTFFSKFSCTIWTCWKGTLRFSCMVLLLTQNRPKICLHWRLVLYLLFCHTQNPFHKTWFFHLLIDYEGAGRKKQTLKKDPSTIKPWKRAQLLSNSLWTFFGLMVIANVQDGNFT